MKNGLVLAVSAVILITGLAMNACAVEETTQISVNYVPPKNPAYQQIYTATKEHQALEKLQKFLSPFRLSRALEISLKECGGEADAMYGDGSITICYEYVEELQGSMPAQITAAGIEPIDTLAGPLVDTVLHEFAHALFDILDIPILGREEDAADQVAAYIYLQLGKVEARRLIMGTVYAYMLEVQDTGPPTMAEFADEHSTSEQRAFNLLCIAYGADPELFEDVATWGALPEERAEICEEEFEHISYAYHTLIGPHIDPDLAKKVFDRTWLPEK